MTDWSDTLPGIHDRVWQTLTRGVADRHAPGRHLALATVAPDGAPQVRTVVLRAADRTAATIDIHTDLRSAKIAALTANPLAEALVWDPRAHLQIRLSGPVAILTGNDVAPLWARIPDTARVSYGNTPGPGTPIPGPRDHAPGDGAAVFAVLRMAIARIDALHLGDPHRRAQFVQVDGWAGGWLSP
jgi:hypothetical protein